jgi:uncharacterized integral membrane protein
VDGEHDPTAPPPSEPTTQPHEPAPEPEPHAEAPPPEPEVQQGPGRLYAKILALLFFVGYSAAFVVGNDRKIKVDFVFATANVSLIWTILLLLAVGLVGGLLVTHLYRERRSKKARKP